MRQKGVCISITRMLPCADARIERATIMNSAEENKDSAEEYNNSAEVYKDSAEEYKDSLWARQ